MNKRVDKSSEMKTVWRQIRVRKKWKIVEKSFSRLPFLFSWHASSASLGSIAAEKIWNSLTGSFQHFY